MSLATRCPACGTVFRVVPDQLKVSEGWVRCGRCSEVFNGAQRLFELDAGAPTTPPRPDEAFAAPRATPPRVADAPVPPAVPAAAKAAPTTADAAAADGPTPGAAIREAAPTAAPAESSGNPIGERPAGGTDETAEPTAETAETAETVESVESVESAESVPAEAPDAAAPAVVAAPSPATPGFVRRAERAARWRSPRRRAALAVLSLCLALLLVAQVGLQYRDHVAARWPATLPWLQSACAALNCRVEPPRYIDALNVDSSGLVRLPDSALYQLSLVVQNKAPMRVRMPAVDLALTDLQGQTTVRRVLTAAELGQAADAVPAGGEVTLQATLELGERRIAGYTIELFYP